MKLCRHDLLVVVNVDEALVLVVAIDVRPPIRKARPGVPSPQTRSSAPFSHAAISTSPSGRRPSSDSKISLLMLLFSLHLLQFLYPLVLLCSFLSSVLFL
jgi:hypothetical protein